FKANQARDTNASLPALFSVADFASIWRVLGMSRVNRAGRGTAQLNAAAHVPGHSAHDRKAAGTPRLISSNREDWKVLPVTPNHQNLTRIREDAKHDQRLMLRVFA